MAVLRGFYGAIKYLHSFLGPEEFRMAPTSLKLRRARRGLTLVPDAEGFPCTDGDFLLSWSGLLSPRPDGDAGPGWRGQVASVYLACVADFLELPHHTRLRDLLRSAPGGAGARPDVLLASLLAHRYRVPEQLVTWQGPLRPAPLSHLVRGGTDEAVSIWHGGLGGPCSIARGTRSGYPLSLDLASARPSSTSASRWTCASRTWRLGCPASSSCSSEPSLSGPLRPYQCQAIAPAV